MTSGLRVTCIVRVLVLVVAIASGVADAQTKPRATGGPKASRDAMPSAAGTEALLRTESAFPTGDRATSIILIERASPVEVRRGQGFSYEITVTNLTRSDIYEVMLSEEFPAAFKAETITPEPTRRAATTASWRYKSFPAGGKAVIQVVGSTDRPDDLSWCAKVTFNAGLCATTKVVEPALKLTKIAPAEVIVCDPIPVKLVVTNTGTGAVQDVKVTDKLPEGWEAMEGKGTVAFSAGTLKPGESREFTFQARSAGTGKFVNEATAAEPGGLTAKASSETVVRQPVLAVTKAGPEMRYIGRPVEYKITVSNTGDAPARDTMLVDAISGVGEFVKAGEGGQFAGGKVTWALGTLAPGASKTVGLTLVGKKAGTIKDEAVATAYCAEARASASTEVQGVAAILLEVVDVADPIEVGADETYVITVTNQGTAADNNIRIECTLPAEEDFVSADGPTKSKATGETVVFEPVPSLAPKDKLVYRVVVKGRKAADARFKTLLTSDMLSGPVEESESTHIY